jgi:hypothetical protein
MELHQLDTDTLHHFLMEETKKFTAALRDGASPDRLRSIRNHVQELLRILNRRKLDEKEEEKRNDQNNQAGGSSYNGSPEQGGVR